MDTCCVAQRIVLVSRYRARLSEFSCKHHVSGLGRGGPRGVRGTEVNLVRAVIRLIRRMEQQKTPGRMTGARISGLFRQGLYRARKIKQKINRHFHSPRTFNEVTPRPSRRVKRQGIASVFSDWEDEELGYLS